MLWVFWVVLLACLKSDVHAQQHYDPSGCSEDTNYPGSRYTCNSSQVLSCSAYLVYRANQYCRTVSDVSELLRVDQDELLRLNHLESPFSVLEPGREVLVPITCSCTGQFFQAGFSYGVPQDTTVSEVACSVFEGLLTSRTLTEENTASESYVKAGTKLHVPLRCACPDNSSGGNRVKYLVTYPLVEGDGSIIVSKKFGISPEDLWTANHLETWPTVYPNTTILVPLKTRPVINFSIPTSPPPAPGFLPTTAVERRTSSKLRTLYIAGSVVGFTLVAGVLAVCGLYVKALHKQKVVKLQSFNTRTSRLSCSTARSSPRSGQTGRSSPVSCLSPDLLVGIKYSLKNYSVEDLMRATKDFSEETKIGDQAYRGLIANVSLMIKQMKFEDTRQVIDIHSRINHINIVNLIGVCYGENDFSWSYLVFELPSHGCLRDLLSNSGSPLQWTKRTQIAFDIATGLHYLHYYIFPSYAHMNVNSRHIFVTSNWRAKLSSIRVNPVGGCPKGKEDIQSVRAWVAPESTTSGSASEKVDVFAFGVVLLELISGKEGVDGEVFKDSIRFLGGGGNEGGCFEQLRSFMDPCLKGDYSLSEALCLAVLASACVEDDPSHRPSIDDILKVLVRMV